MRFTNSLSSYYEKFLATVEVKCIDDEIPFEIPQGWEWCRLGVMCTKFSTGPFGTMVHKSDYVENGVPLVNPTNIKNSIIDKANIKCVSVEKFKELNSYVLSENDIVLARRGDLSKCAVVSACQNGWLAGTGAFFLQVPHVNFSYFCLFYMSVYVQEYLLGDSVGTTMNNLNQALLSRLLVPCPPSKEQERIVKCVDTITPLIDRYTMSQADLNKLREVL